MYLRTRKISYYLAIQLLCIAEGAGGQYRCVAENSAGRAETNYTLNVGHFAGPGALNTGELVGVVSSSASKSSIRRFVIMEKAPTRAFSWLKAATTAFTFKTLC